MARFQFFLFEWMNKVACSQGDCLFQSCGDHIVAIVRGFFLRSEWSISLFGIDTGVAVTLVLPSITMFVVTNAVAEGTM